MYIVKCRAELERDVAKVVEVLATKPRSEAIGTITEVVKRWLGHKDLAHCLFHGKQVSETFDPETGLAWTAYFPEQQDESGSTLVAALRQFLLHLPGYALHRLTMANQRVWRQVLLDSGAEYLTLRKKRISRIVRKLTSGAEGKAENEKKLVMPENLEVQRLIRELNKNARLPHPETKLHVARMFTNNDEAKAQSLLRQVRAYCHLLRESE